MRGHGAAALLRRIVVAGGTGFFGSTIAALLRTRGIEPVIAGRGADAPLDVEDPRSLRAVLRQGDVVVDAAGPFQSRSTSLIEVAMTLGVDVVDINESLPYAKRVAALADRLASSGIAVLSSCSAVSTVAAILTMISGIAAPVRVSALVAPAARETAHVGTLRALLASVGATIEIWRDGRLVSTAGWRQPRRFRLPPRKGYLVESALSLELPRLWPSLRIVDCWTDTGTIGANSLLWLIALSPVFRRLVLRALPLGALLARVAGARRGAFALEVEAAAGDVARLAFMSERGSYRVAAAPAALAAQALAVGRFGERGLVPPDRHLSRDELLNEFARLGIELRRA